MKKFLISMLSTFLMASNLIAADGNSTILEQLRAEKVEDFKSNLESIALRTNNYILNTADLTITRKELQIFDSLPYYFFNNFENTTCSNNGTYCNAQTGNDGIQVILDTKTLTLRNVLGVNPNSYVIQAFTTTSDNSMLITSDYNYTVQIPLDTVTSNFISLIDKINDIPNAYIGITAPTDTTKTWYFPNGTGGFDIKKYNSATGKWEDIGSTGTNGQSSVQASSEDELFNIPCLKNDKGFVVENGSASEYICSQDGEWTPISTGSSGFNGQAEMLKVVTTLMKKTGGSIANVSDPNQTGVLNVYPGQKDFVKKDSTSNNGYWIDSTNMFIATDSYTTLTTINAAEGSFAFLPNASKSSVLTLKRTSNRWMYLANGYRDIVTNFSFVPENQAIIIDMKNSAKLFGRTSTYFDSYSNLITKDNKIRMSNNDRSAMPSSSAIQLYLLMMHDCTSTTCNGSTSPYYAGSTNDGMYEFYYSTGGKRENNLVDAVPATSMADVYLKNAAAAIYNNVVYIKDVDTLGRTCYKNTSGTYYTKSGSAIPTGNNLPTAKTCETATYSGNYLVLDNRTQATDWSAAPHAAGVNIGGTNYAHILVSGKDFWTNNSSGDGQASATEIFTRGTRTSFPVVTHSINALTKNVDTPNYTGSGVVSSIDNSFKQWFYSSSGSVTKINNLLDLVPCTWSNCYSNTIATNAKFGLNIDGKILTYDGTYWYIKNSTNKILKKLDGYYHIDNGIINYAIGRANNGLFFDNCDKGLSVTHSVAASYCSSIGMKLPSPSEARAWNINGVPSCNNYTWTSARDPYDGDNWQIWSGTSKNLDPGSDYFAVRCVK